MRIPMVFFKNEMITALVMACVTTVIVLINLPRHPYLDENNELHHVNRTWVALKTFAMTLVIVYALLYFFASDPNSSLISNMIKEEPDF